MRTPPRRPVAPLPPSEPPPVRRRVRDWFIRGLLIGLFVGIALVFAAQLAGLNILPAVQLPAASPRPSPTATPYPPLDAQSSVRVIADRLPGRIASLMLGVNTRGQSLGRGKWLVKWGDAEWEVDERTHQVTPLTDDARFFSNLPGP